MLELFDFEPCIPYHYVLNSILKLSMISFLSCALFISLLLCTLKYLFIGVGKSTTVLRCCKLGLLARKAWYVSGPFIRDPPPFLGTAQHHSVVP